MLVLIEKIYMLLKFHVIFSTLSTSVLILLLILIGSCFTSSCCDWLDAFTLIVVLGVVTISYMYTDLCLTLKLSLQTGMLTAILALVNIPLTALMMILLLRRLLSPLLLTDPVRLYILSLSLCNIRVFDRLV